MISRLKIDQKCVIFKVKNYMWVQNGWINNETVLVMILTDHSRARRCRLGSRRLCRIADAAAGSTFGWTRSGRTWTNWPHSRAELQKSKINTFFYFISLVSYHLHSLWLQSAHRSITNQWNFTSFASLQFISVRNYYYYLLL